MPFAMTYFIQSVLVQETVYFGGGDADPIDRDHIVHPMDTRFIVLAYNTTTGNWTELPRYKTCYFGMTKINNQLIIVGGWEGIGVRSKMLGVWGPGANSWAHPYPNMPTTRSRCSAVGYHKWLIIAGGRDDYGCSLPIVEVMDTENKQWHTAPPTPVAWDSMKMAIISDTCYFLGGHTTMRTHLYVQNNMYSVSLPDLLSQLDSTRGGKEIWKELAGPALTPYRFSPLSISGSLLAVGGQNDLHSYEAESAIHLYKPASGVWVKVGDLPAPRHSCTCIAISEKEILVAGGYLRGQLSNLDIAHWTKWRFHTTV